MSTKVDSNNKVLVDETIRSSSITTIQNITSFANETSVNNITGIGYDSSPSKLAEIFLEFVSLGLGEVKYTGEELRCVRNIVTSIHQRHYKQLREK